MRDDHTDDDAAISTVVAIRLGLQVARASIRPPPRQNHLVAFIGSRVNCVAS
jgi:hypothetical protein